MDKVTRSFRQKHDPIVLLRTAVGSPADVTGKVTRVVRTLVGWADSEEIRRRLKALKDAGYIRQMPSPVQLAMGTLDAFRYFLIPGSADFYQQLGINFWFHQVLRWLDDPVSMLDPAGFFSERDTIIGHLLQVVHHDPVYDFQLLLMFPDGLDEMEKQVRQAIDGTHPRSRTLRATIEDETYYLRLLEMLLEFRKDPKRTRFKNDAFFRLEDADFWRAERTFSDVTGFMDYSARLPDDPVGVFRHLFFDQVIPRELATGPGKGLRG